MKELDLYYSALNDYCKQLEEEKSHIRFMQAALKAPAREDRLETIRTKCEIDEQWVVAIEKCIPYIEKAIKEDRQFIRQEGETVPIEKAKKVSKTSVTHLARHSDYITHLPEDEKDPLLPDKIYVTENESNYAIYENRFLYMLLCYTRDFVELRYTKISELGNTYRGSLKISKHIEIGKRTVTFDAALQDISKNDNLYGSDNGTNEIIERIEAIRVQVSALLMTPLMNEVAKAPMIRPPVTRTNVLKMNNNFIHAVALYDYLSAYEGAGYTISEIKNSFGPFPDKMAEQIFESIPMLLFLVYKYGNGLEGELKYSYEKRLAETALQHAGEEAKRLKKLREKIKDDPGAMDDYLLSMQSYTENLEQSVQILQTEQKQIEARLERMKAEIEWQKQLEERIRSAMAETQKQNQSLQKDIADEKAASEEKLTSLRKQYNETLEACDGRWQEQIDSLRVQYDKEKDDLVQKIAELEQKIEEGANKATVLRARLHAYQARCKDPLDEDLTEEEKFKRLERERDWFETMFKATWKETKKRIRKETLWKKKQNKEAVTPESDEEGKSKD